MSDSQNKKIIIVGGGTAGWMTALLMARAWHAQGWEIGLLESTTVGTVGVGEGSTPALKLFFEKLGIAEAEWMPACNATYKCGIQFDGWSGRPGYESYFHPFASLLDKHSLPLFMQNAQLRVQGLDVDAHPNRFFISKLLAQHNLAPKPAENFPFDIQYGYHFDAGLLGKFLAAKAATMGVKHLIGHITQVRQASDGSIAALQLEDGAELAADFFVDCSGFAGLLIQQTLQTPFHSYQHNLLNDAAVALPSEIGTAIPSATLSTALKNGWSWKIPLTNRFGNGYVYSSAFCSADQAEVELRASLGLLDADIPVKHLKMKVGRVTAHWNKNCLAVGLAQGFIEPLEATALFLVQQTAAIFIEDYERGFFSDKYQAAFNQRINGYFDGTRDYIVTHYKTSARTDTEYWRANIANPQDISATMAELYSSWMNGKDLNAEVARLQLTPYYAAPSWYCIFAGMGIFPSGKKLRKAQAQEDRIDLAALDNFLRRCALNFPDHRQSLSK